MSNQNQPTIPPVVPPTKVRYVAYAGVPKFGVLLGVDNGKLFWSRADHGGLSQAMTFPSADKEEAITTIRMNAPEAEIPAQMQLYYCPIKDGGDFATKEDLVRIGLPCDWNVNEPYKPE